MAERGVIRAKNAVLRRFRAVYGRFKGGTGRGIKKNKKNLAFWCGKYYIV
jgi:hypothetical protein